MANHKKEGGEGIALTQQMTTTTTSTRQQIEREIVNRVIKDALAAGFTISVDNGGEELELSRSSSYDDVVASTMLTDDEHVHLHGNGMAVNWVWFVYGNCGWDVICDYTVGIEAVLAGAEALAEKYEEQYFKAGHGVDTRGDA